MTIPFLAAAAAAAATAKRHVAQAAQLSAQMPAARSRGYLAEIQIVFLSQRRKASWLAGSNWSQGYTADRDLSLLFCSGACGIRAAVAGFGFC